MALWLEITAQLVPGRNSLLFTILASDEVRMMHIPQNTASNLWRRALRHLLRHVCNAEQYK
jgi:hypothetical protein